MQQQSDAYSHQISQLIKSHLHSYLTYRNSEQIIQLGSLYSYVHQSCSTKQGYFSSLLNLALASASTPDAIYMKELLLISIEKTVTMVAGKKNDIEQEIIEKFVFAIYSIESIKIFKLIRSIICRAFQFHSFDYQRGEQMIGKKLHSKQNLVQALVIVQSLSTASKFEVQTNSISAEKFFENCFCSVTRLLQEHIKDNVLVAYLCCRCLSNFWQFIQSEQYFGILDQHIHEHWLDGVQQILKGKWYIPNLSQIDKQHQTIQSTYLHTKKYATRALVLFLKRNVFRFQGSKKKQDKKKKLFNKISHFLPSLLNEVICELQYDCYPDKVRKEHVKFIRTICQFQRNLIDQPNRKKIKKSILKLIQLTLEDEENIVSNPLQTWFQNSDEFNYYNLRMMATNTWIEISFDFSKNKGKSNIEKESLGELFHLIGNQNLIECEVGLNILAHLDFPKIKNQNQILPLFKKVGQLLSASAILIRNSSFQVVSKMASSQVLNIIEDSVFMKLAQICYEHLTNDEAILVRINAGICLLKLSLKGRCVNQFKIVIYQCIIILLKLVEQVAIEQIGSLIHQILTNQQYEEALQPLSKEILFYSCNCLSSLFLKMQQNISQQQDQCEESDRILLFDQCAQIIILLLQKLTCNDLKSNQEVSLKIFATLKPIMDENNNKKQGKASSFYDFDIIDSTIKIISTYLRLTPNIKIDLLNEAIAFLINVCLLQQVELVEKIDISILLTKFIQKYPNPSNIFNFWEEILEKENKLQAQDQKSSYNILKAILVINVIPNNFIQTLSSNESHFLKQLILQKSTNLIGMNQHKQIQILQHKENLISFGFLVSCLITCHFEDILTKLKKKFVKEKQIINFFTTLFINLNKKLQSPDKSINKLILKFYVLAASKILWRILSLPNVIFIQNQQIQLNNAPGAENLQKIKLSQMAIYIKNFICLMKFHTQYEVPQDHQQMEQLLQENEQMSQQEQCETFYLENHNFDKYYNRLNSINEYAQAEKLFDYLLNQRKDIVSFMDPETINQLKQVLSKTKSIQSNINEMEESVFNLMKIKSNDGKQIRDSIFEQFIHYLSQISNQGYFAFYILQLSQVTFFINFCKFSLYIKFSYLKFPIFPIFPIFILFYFRFSGYFGSTNSHGKQLLLGLECIRKVSYISPSDGNCSACNFS